MFLQTWSECLIIIGLCKTADEQLRAGSILSRKDYTVKNECDLTDT